MPVLRELEKLPTLSVRAREVLSPRDGEVRQVVEVLKGGEVIGQLPVTRVVYEMLPSKLGTVRIDLLAELAEITATPPCA